MSGMLSIIEKKNNLKRCLYEYKYGVKDRSMAYDQKKDY